MTMKATALAALAAALLLSGCFGGGPRELLTLRPAQTPPVQTPRTAGPGEALTIVEPTVPQALRADRIAVYVEPQTVQYLKDAYWAENPGRLFRHLLSEVIAASTGRVLLDPAQFTHDPGTRLTGQLHMFGLDEARMEAVVLYEAALAPRQGAVTTNRFEARVPVAGVEPAQVAPALNEAANRVAAQVAAWVGR